MLMNYIHHNDGLRQIDMVKVIDVKVDRIDKEKLTKCPICNGELYAYSLMGVSRVESCYCPECDIVRQYMMSMPFLCSQCYSRSFYEKDGKHYCWFCGNDEIIGIKYEDAKEQGLFDAEGFKLSGIFVDKKNGNRDDCKHGNNTNRRHNKTVFRFECGDCGDAEYIMIPEWLQKEQNIKNKIV